MKRIDVSAFIDWQSQLINSRAIMLTLPTRAAKKAIDFTVKSIADVLEQFDERAAFFVYPKLYHGWHRGLTPTENLRALNRVIADREAPTRFKRASFNWAQPFGNILSNCSDHRLHRTLRVHLPNTLRADLEDPSRMREKMVDTALTCDVLASARSSPADIRLILGEDDDLVPAAFTAESWGKERGGKTFILRNRDASEHLNMTGLYRKLERPDDH